MSDKEVSVNAKWLAELSNEFSRLKAKNILLREYYEARESVRKIGVVHSTAYDLERERRAIEAMQESSGE